ncbi:hypothetical protein N9Y67_00340 [Pseudomonadota bacterium]|nr:hypothetical protein [Pseudomonadota bacterium]
MAVLDEYFWDNALWKAVSVVSVVTTVGFVRIAYTFVQHYLKA